MRSRRGLAAIVAATTAPCAAIALISACSLTTSTDGLSGGAVLPLDATTNRALSDGPTADRASSGVDAQADPDAHTDATVPFPPEAQTWPGNGHGYAVYVVPGGITWFDARDRAVQAGGHLATLGTSEENAFVMTMVTGRNDAFNDGVGPWLGGYQDNPTPADEPAGKWRWVDSTPWSFTFWFPTQPDNSGNENYLDVYKPGAVAGWNDTAIGASPAVIGYIVEYE